MPDIGNWTDYPCWYVSVQDVGNTAAVLGPFRTEAACREYAYYHAEDGGNPAKQQLVRVAANCDPKSHFYSWGMVKMSTGHRSGCLNTRVHGWELDAQREAA